MAAEHWFRWHHGTVNDPKWRVVASRCVTNVTVGHVVAVWAAMMENASLASPRGELDGWNDEDVAAGFGFTTEQVQSIREAMQGKVLDGNNLAAWEKRQPKREDSAADRTRAYRDRKANQGDAPTEAVTQCDAAKRTVTLETETETETDIKANTPIVPTGDSEAIVSVYNSTLPNCQSVSVLNPKRKKRIAAVVKLARSVCAEQGWPYEPHGFWSAYFTECAKDPWMRGEVANPKNPTWKQNLDVLLAEDRFAGVMDGAIAAMRSRA